MNIIRNNKIFLSVMACFFLIIAAIFITRSYTVKADVATMHSDGSFQSMSQAAADYFGNYTVGVSTGDKTIKKINKAGTAGAVLGFTDSSINPDNVHDVITNGTFSYNGTEHGSYSYDMLRNMQGATTAGPVFLHYGGYGLALNQLGLDHTAGNVMVDNFRKPIGTILLVLYIAADFLYDFWELVLSILDNVNPFILFLGNQGQVGQFGTIGGSKMSEGITEIIDTIGDFYTTVRDAGINVFLPLFIAVAFFIWLVIKKGKEPFNTFKGLLLRVAFIAFGIPLLFAFYSTAVGLTQQINEDVHGMASDAILSTFVDFEAWTVGADSEKAGELNRLSVKKTGNTPIVMDFDRMRVSGDTMLNVRQICYDINTNVSGTAFSSSTIKDALAIDDNSFLNFDRAIFDTYKSDNAVSGDTSKYVINLLERYANGEKISGATYENSEKVHFMKFVGVGGGLPAGTYYNIICMLSDKWQAYDPDRAYTSVITNVYGQDIAVYKTIMSAFAKTRFAMDGIETEYPSYWSLSAEMHMHLANITTIKSGLFYGDLDYNGKFNGSKLSMIAMYNYLNSRFDDAQITINSNKIPDNVDKIEHYSVNAVGSVLLQIAFIIDIITAFAAICVIGYGYGFGLLIMNFKAMFKIIPVAFTGLLGSLKGIASTIILVFALIIEILVTCALYSLASQMVLSLYDIIFQPITLLFAGVKSTGDGIMFPVVTSILSNLIILYFIKNLLAWRYAICQTLTENATSIINKFLSTEVGAPDLSTNGLSRTQMVGAAAGAVLASAAVDSGSASKAANSIGERIESVTGRNAAENMEYLRTEKGMTFLPDSNGNTMTYAEAEQMLQNLGKKTPSQSKQDSVSGDSQSDETNVQPLYTHSAEKENAANSQDADSDSGSAGKLSKQGISVVRTTKMRRVRKDNKYVIRVTKVDEATNESIEEDIDDTAESRYAYYIDDSAAFDGTSASDFVTQGTYSMGGKSGSATYAVVANASSGSSGSTDSEQNVTYSVVNTETNQVLSGATNLQADNIQVNDLGDIQIVNENEEVLYLLSNDESDA